MTTKNFIILLAFVISGFLIGGFLVGYDLGRKTVRECSIPEGYCKVEESRAVQGCEITASNIHFQLKMRDYDLKKCEELMDVRDSELSKCKRKR